MANNKEKLVNLVNSSGFPLQIRVAHEVATTKNQHGWQVISHEHSWINKNSGKSGFIDLVLGDQHGTLKMVIECKRVQDSRWIFLLPTKNEKVMPRVMGFLKYHSYRQPGNPKYFDWVNLQAYPETYESEFCVVPGQNDRSRPMLERISGELINATEAFAEEELISSGVDQIQQGIYFNLVVTTADLFICSFLPEDIALADGKIEPDSAEVKSVEFLRFRKQLNPRQKTTQKENTVFVVNSNYISKFLESFNVIDRSLPMAIRG